MNYLQKLIILKLILYYHTKEWVSPQCLHTYHYKTYVNKLNYGEATAHENKRVIMNKVSHMMLVFGTQVLNSLVCFLLCCLFCSPDAYC